MFSFRNHKRKVRKNIELVASGTDLSNKSVYTFTSTSSGDPPGPCTAHIVVFGGDASADRVTTDTSLYNSVASLEELDMGTIRSCAKLALFNVNSTSATLTCDIGGQLSCISWIFYRIDGLLDRKKLQGSATDTDAGSDTTEFSGWLGKFDASKAVIAAHLNSTAHTYSEGGVGSTTASPDKNWEGNDDVSTADAEFWGLWATLDNIDPSMTDGAYVKATSLSQRNRGQLGVLM